MVSSEQETSSSEKLCHLFEKHPEGGEGKAKGREGKGAENKYGIS